MKGGGENVILARVEIREVKQVPIFHPVMREYDDDYLLTAQRLYPDPLYLRRDEWSLAAGQWRCLWVMVGIADLSAQEWLHVNCLTSHYGVSVFSEEHWMLLKAYMENPARYGVNPLLTPVFTSPLDTVGGEERSTMRLENAATATGAKIEIAFTGNWLTLHFDTRGNEEPAPVSGFPWITRDGWRPP